uniref:Uncharacterized protein n=1 Tax=Ditylenchus dipsaci TaxID=166011 RepID=A0A915DVC2_9BILA
MTKSSSIADINNNSSSENHRLAVIGGGPGGISFCMQLFTKLKQVVLNNTLEVLIFEKTTKCNGQFTEWLGDKYKGDYPPRHVYGKYMEHLAEQLQLEADNHPPLV